MLTGSTVCASRSEMERKGFAERHLGFGASLGSDWTGGLGQNFGLEDLIGSNPDTRGKSAKHEKVETKFCGSKICDLYLIRLFDPLKQVLGPKDLWTIYYFMLPLF